MAIKYSKIMVGDSVVKIFKYEDIDEYLKYIKDAPDGAETSNISEEEYDELITSGRFYPVDADGNPVPEIDGLTDTEIRLEVLKITKLPDKLPDISILDMYYRWVRGYEINDKEE